MSCWWRRWENHDADNGENPELRTARVGPANVARASKDLQGDTNIRVLVIDLRCSHQNLREWEDFWQTVASLSSLRALSIYLSYQDVNFGELERLLKQAQQVTKVWLSAPFITSQTLPCLCRGIEFHPKLEVFRLSSFGNRLNEKDRYCLRLALFSIPRLKQLYLNPYAEGDDVPNHVVTISSVFLVPLFRKQSLRHIVLSRFELDHESFQGSNNIADSKLEELTLTRCNVTSAGMRAFLGTITTIPSLKTLDLDAIAIPDYDARRDSQIMSALSTSTSLTDLSFGFSGTSPHRQDQWPRFDFLLEDSSALQRLSLICSATVSNLDIHSFASLCQALEYHTSLVSLTLKWFNINDTYIDPLVEMLRDNSSLTELKLVGNSFTGSGLFRLFSGGLVDNTTLKTLDLQPSSRAVKRQTVSSSDLALFVKRVITNETSNVTSLTVGPCELHDLQSLLPVVEQSYRLEELVFHGRPGMAAAASIKEVQKVIGTITKLNKVGRGYLDDDGGNNHHHQRGPFCTVAGVNVLSKVADDLDCIYYHLLENPLLCYRKGGNNDNNQREN